MRHTCSTCGYCKSGVLLSEVSNGREDPCETCEVITVNEFTNWRPIPTTNADRFRAKSDEELAKTLSGEEIYPWCTNPCEYDNCTDCVLAWLKKEAGT